MQSYSQFTDADNATAEWSHPDKMTLLVSKEDAGLPRPGCLGATLYKEQYGFSAIRDKPSKLLRRQGKRCAGCGEHIKSGTPAGSYVCGSRVCLLTTPPYLVHASVVPTRLP